MIFFQKNPWHISNTVIWYIHKLDTRGQKENPTERQGCFYLMYINYFYLGKNDWVHYFFVWDNALPAQDLEDLFWLASFKTLLAMEETFLDVCFLFTVLFTSSIKFSSKTFMELVEKMTRMECEYKLEIKRLQERVETLEKRPIIWRRMKMKKHPLSMKMKKYCHTCNIVFAHTVLQNI